MTVTFVFAILELFTIAGAIYAGYRQAAEIANNNQAEAAKWGTFVQIFNALLISVIVSLVLLHNQELMTEGFAKTFRYLEVLTRGR